MPEHEVIIEGVPVTFPFKPYDVQVEFMSKVISCLEEGRHGVLESPTGTGKTLSLLCSSLAWLLKRKVTLRNKLESECVEGREVVMTGGWGGQCGKVIYASRTHSQLRQVMRQFETTIYRKLFKPTVIGSRDHMCINSLVKKEESLSHKNMRCSLLVKGKQCRYYHSFKAMSGGLSGTDIMAELSKPEAAKTCCPYYLGREAVPLSDVIFMPYNYLMDIQIYKKLKLNLKESVIIVDEGHNVAKVCEESTSVSIGAAQVAACISDLTSEMQQYYDQVTLMGDGDEREYSPDDLVFLQQRLLHLEKFFSSLDPPQDGIVHKGSHIFNVFSECEINSENRCRVVELLNAVGESLSAQSSSTSSFSNKGASLKRMADSIDLVFSCLDGSDYDKIDLSFKVVVGRETSEFYRNKGKKPPPPVLHFWCLNPSFLLKKLLEFEVRSVIITSGTLSPLHAAAEELGFSNAVTLSSKHIVRKFQVLMCTLAKGPMNYELKCTYSNREDRNYWRELGMTVINVSRHVPNGMLVFFPSYVTMRKAQEEWSGSGLMSQLSSIKSVFIEPSNKDEMEEILSNYSLAVDNNAGGAVLFGVCRGKISEGLDFSGKYARGVIITGIPYAPPKDKRVQLKREFIDDNKKMFKDLSGDVWYHIDAMRAVNQAVGRAIRHCADFGIIVLCDSRLHQNQTINKRLPAWLLPFLAPCPTFGSLIQTIRRFFKTVEENKESLVIDSSLPNTVPQDAIVNQDEDKFLSLTGPTISLPSMFSQSVPSTSVSSTSNFGSSFQFNATPSKKLDDVNVEKLKHVSLFNKAVIETNITADTDLQVKPAKKRRIVITSSMGGAIEEIRRSDIKSFILDVKLTLDEASYATFAFIIKKYNQTNNFDETVEALRTLFLSDEVGCEDLFKGCYRMFSEEHKVAFNQRCEALFNKA